MIEAELVLKTNDLERAKRFYGAIAQEMGYNLLSPMFSNIWKIGDNLILTLVLAAEAERAVRHGCDGSRLCLFAKEFDQVDSVCERVAALGATELDEPHTPDAFYRASFCDPDGHRIVIACGI